MRLHDERQAKLVRIPEGDVLDTEGMRAKAEIDSDQAKRRAEYELAVREMEELYA